MAGYDIHAYNGMPLVVVVLVFLPLAWFAVGLRSYTRIFLIHSFRADDYLMLVGLSIFTTFCALILTGIKAGMGHHDVDIANHNARVQALMWQALALTTYIIAMMFIKLSIGVFLLRLSIEPVYRWILWISLVVVGVWSTVMFFWDIFQCNPVYRQWDYSVQNSYCIGSGHIISAAYAITVMTILSDWLYALLPAFMLWNVKMTKQAKVTVLFILGMGVFASIATLIRIRFLSSLSDSDDFLYQATDALVWSVVEPGLAIVASSLATIRPLLRKLNVRGFEATAHDSSASQSRRTRLSRTISRRFTLPFHRGVNELKLNEYKEPQMEVKQKMEPIQVGGAAEYHDEKALSPLSPPPQAAIRKSSKIDGFFTEEQVMSPSWSGRDSGSRHSSVDQIYTLEAQQVDDGRPGLRSHGSHSSSWV